MSELPIIYENPRFNQATPTLKPVIDRATRFVLVLLMEWGTLTMIEDSPRYVKFATIVVAALGLAVHESWPWLWTRDRRWYPSLMGALSVFYLSLFAYALLTEPSKHSAVSQAAPSGPTMLCFDGACPLPNLKPAPQYLKEIAVTVSPEPGQALWLNATAETTADRLRVFVDYAEYRAGWMKKTRAFVGEFKEPVRGQNQRLPLINVATQVNAGANDLWWGDPSARHYVWTPGPSSPLPAGIVHARVAVVGPTGQEQHHYFTLLTRLAEPSTYRVGVLPDYESNEWISQWEKE